jgi:hypothetical protein
VLEPLFFNDSSVPIAMRDDGSTTRAGRSATAPAVGEPRSFEFLTNAPASTKLGSLPQIATPIADRLDPVGRG